MADMNKNDILSYANPHVSPPVARKYGYGLMIFVLTLLSLPAMVGAQVAFSESYKSSHLEVVFGYGMIILLLAFVATLPASIVALVWWGVLFFRRPRFGWDCLTFALLALVAYFAITGTILAVAFSTPLLGRGSDFH